MKKILCVSMLALAITAMLSAPRTWAQNGGQQTITIKDPAEYNAYTNAVGQTSPQAQAAAMEGFLQQYPQSVVKVDVLQRLLGVYQQTGNMDKMLDAAKRLVQADPGNLRGLAAATYILRSQAEQKSNPAEAQPLFDQAAKYAQQGLSAAAPAGGDAASYNQVKTAVKPIFLGAIAADDLNKKDYADAIQNFHMELAAMPVAQTVQGNGLQDTYMLGNAYVQETPQDMVKAVWYLARAAVYAPEPFHTQIQKAAHYWYKKYHGGLDGFDQVQAQAKAALDPPAGFTIQPAPPPPSPLELASQTVANTPDLNSLGLSDKEFILANGKPEDANKVWATMKDLSTKVPGMVISATADQVMLAVSDDAQQSKKADFTINMKKPLTKLPAVGSTVNYIATFDSYTQNPPMIIMKDGVAPPTAKPRPAHRRRSH